MIFLVLLPQKHDPRTLPRHDFADFPFKFITKTLLRSDVLRFAVTRTPPRRDFDLFALRSLTRTLYLPVCGF